MKMRRANNPAHFLTFPIGSSSADYATFVNEQTSGTRRINISNKDDREIRKTLKTNRGYRNAIEGILIPILLDLSDNMRQTMANQLLSMAKKGKNRG